MKPREMKYGLLTAVVVVVAAAISAAVYFKSAKPAKPDAKHPSRMIFEKIRDCELSLEVVSPRTEYYRGETDATITLRLKNVGLKPVTIREWFLHEPDNVRLLYARCEGKPEDLPESAWRKCVPSIREPVPRLPLDLNPNNMALLTANLDFLKEMGDSAMASPKASYAVVGELNLTSVSARTKPFIITVK
jgi:hypothetical protein